MNIVSGGQDKMAMLLKQLGASVQTIHGSVCFVKFMIEDTEVSYVYNINAKEQFFLQRISPYPLGAGVFVSEEHVVAHIQMDIEKFRNASKSKTFQKYVEINNRTHKAIHNIEETFMNYNVPIDALHKIEAHLNDISTILENVEQTSPKIGLDVKGQA